MIWFWVFTAFVLIVLGLFIFSQGAYNLGPAISTIGVVILLILIVSPARGHEHSRPDLNPWFNQLRSGKGQCCSNNDGTVLSDVDWESRGGQYRVRIGGAWVDVPPDAFVTEPNLDGRAMVWPLYGNSGLTIRCFMPGLMG